MKKAAIKALLKRLDALSENVESDVPDITFIEQEGDKFIVEERYSTPRGVKFKRLIFDSPDEYIPKGGIVFTGAWRLED